MGLLDVIKSSSDAVDAIDVSDASDVGMAAGATVGTAATSGAMTILPLAGKILVEEPVKDYMKNVGKKGYEPVEGLQNKG